MTIAAGRFAFAVADDAAPPWRELLAVLAEEAIDAAAEPLVVALAGNPAEVDVMVVWSAHELDVRVCAAIVVWAGGRTPAVGLLGWCERGDRATAERALAAGFDDAQVGPCPPRELAVRLRAIQRRVQRHAARADAAPGRLRFHDLLLDPETLEVWSGRRPIPLTLTEFTMLVTLLRARGAVLTRGELLDRVWGGAQLDVGERAVDNVILRLRRKLDRPQLIETVRGVGFRIGLEPARGGEDVRP